MLTRDELEALRPILVEYWLPKRIPPKEYWPGYFDVAFLNRLVSLAELKVSSTALILEAGSVVSGAVATSAARECPKGRVIGLDHDVRHQELAKKYSAILGQENIEFLIWNQEKIPLENDSVDAVIDKLSFHHLMKPQKALSETSRVLRKNGKAVISDFVTPEDDGSHRFLNEWAIRQHGKERMTEWRKPSDLVKEISASGLELGKRFDYEFNFTMDMLSAADESFMDWAISYMLGAPPNVKSTLKIKKDRSVSFITPGIILEYRK